MEFKKGFFFPPFFLNFLIFSFFMLSVSTPAQSAAGDETIVEAGTGRGGGELGCGELAMKVVGF